MSTPAATSESQAAATPSSAPGSTPNSAPSSVQEQEGTDEQGIQLPPLSKRHKSAAWNDFVKKKINGVWKAECIWCHNKLGAETRNGTKHLLDHIKTCKSRQVRKGLVQSNLKMGTDSEGRVTVGKYVFDEEVARKELALMICLHEYPICIVDHVGFRRFCAALQPMFKVMSRNTIRKDIIQLFGVNKVAIINYFNKLESRVAITTDMWTASYQKRGYMAVTAHFIDDDWNLKSFLLRFIYVPAPHTGEVISDVLHEVLADWNIDRRLSTITLDNCTTNDNLMDNMKDKLPIDTLLLDGSMLHMRCCAHILNLIVKDGTKIMKDSIEKVRESVAFWAATPKRHEKFEKTARELNIKYEKRLAIDCKTRWNTTYIMLCTALPYQEVFAKLAIRDKLYAPFCPSSDDWKFARELCERLKFFFVATEAFSGSKYATANLFFPKICGIYLAMQKWAASNVPSVKEMSDLMVAKFEKYWGDVHGLLAIATVLDPRYKLHLLAALFTKIYGEDTAAKELDKVRHNLYKLVLQYQDRVEGVGTSDVGMGAYSSVVQGSGGDEVFDIFDQYMSGQSVISESQIRTELDLYLDEQPLPRTHDFDIINWWKFGGIRYPTLRKIARDIMAIPVTTVASESAFSTSGRVISPHRSQLTPELVEALMCVQAWGRADMLGEFADNKNAFKTVLEDEPEQDQSTIITV